MSYNSNSDSSNSNSSINDSENSDHYYYYHLEPLSPEEIHPYLQSYLLKLLDLDDQPIDKYNSNERMIMERCARCGLMSYGRVSMWRKLFIESGYNPKQDTFILLCGKCERKTSDDEKRVNKYGVPLKEHE